MAANRHRKLIESSTNGTSEYPFCKFQCLSHVKLTGFCTYDCIIICPTFCRPAESSPTPSPAISPYAFPPPPVHHHQSLSLPLKISCTFLVFTFIYTLYKFYSVWYRSRPHRSPPPPAANQSTHDHTDVVDHPIWYIRTTGLQPSVINALTVVKFSRSEHTVVDGQFDGTDCTVCLTEFEEDDTLRILPNCKHAFHMPCIDTWLRSHTNCPLCRAGIVDNAVHAPSSERNNNDLGFVGEINLGVLSIRDGDRGEASGSSGLGIGEIDEDDEKNPNS
ncbi:hypothetical protein L1987_85430 [Smallanthus sonchifolius]|uniref:Uncharacterized protein n=1 Tax=Smallanthus sonchifolius TaxID=185202 RepID=A0ACB8XVV2_9ASTR|nr:hypothetical protein L1987_85430 [Smallanthus sonchifolius]